MLKKIPTLDRRQQKGKKSGGIKKTQQKENEV